MVQSMPARSRSNPLALAVLTCLFEKPMHPYEMAQTMRSRAKHESVKLNYGSLYGVVEGLEKRGLIRARETTREGRRPQRTVYEITHDGEVELSEWMAEMVSVPVKEYLRFEAALSFLHALPPDEVPALLRQRCTALEIDIEQIEAAVDGSLKRGLPRLFFVEADYKVALMRRELEFARDLADEIDAGTISGVDMWRSWYEDAATHSPDDAPPPPTDNDDGDTPR
jgi:DNA-binding PadR family transcriptional regulator